MRRNPQSQHVEHLYRQARNSHTRTTAPRFWRDLNAAFWGIWKDMTPEQFNKPLRRPLPPAVSALADRTDAYGVLASYLVVIQAAHDANARLEDVPLT